MIVNYTGSGNCIVTTIFYPSLSYAYHCQTFGDLRLIIAAGEKIKQVDIFYLSIQRIDIIEIDYTGQKLGRSGSLSLKLIAIMGTEFIGEWKP